MKKGYILRNDWLKYSAGIASYAYDETDDKCVYYQLEKFLLSPPSGRPTKFINKTKTSQDALSSYFNGLFKYNEEWTEDYPNFDVNSGVSTEMIAKLCKEIGRSMYAYDEDSKCFSNVITTDKNNHYCPIVFYKLNGHFYIINDPSVMKSVAESNKETLKKIISSSLKDKKEEVSMEVFHIEKFEAENALEMKTGIYLLQQSNLDKEIIDYITMWMDTPFTQNRENVIIKFIFLNNDEEEVIITVDTNYSEGIEYKKMKNVAVQNNINYVNEGVGSVICKVLENSKKEERHYLNQLEKEKLILSFDSECANCNINCDFKDFEIDHIVPLSSGGSNDITNLQPLCISCHKEKTKIENELGNYKVKDEISSYFNDKVLKNISNTSHFKAYQFVEKVNELPQGKTAFKLDMKKCRRNILLTSQYKFPVYSINDIPRQFSGEIRCGMFYINSNNVFPFRGAGWYIEPLVKYGLENELINMTDILLEFIPYKTLPNDYFQKPINTLLDAFSCEPTLQKLSVNAYIGLMGKTCKTLSHSKFTLCPYEASYWYDNSNKDVFIINKELANGEILYEGIFSEKVENEKTTYPIYSMILQMEALELHKLETIINNNGGYILDRNTDAIRYCAKNQINIDDYFWSEGVVKYQTEEAKELKFEKLPRMKRIHTLDITLFEINWNIEYDYEVSPEQKALEIIEGNKSGHIDGPAGTGKTYLTNKIIDCLKAKDVKYLAFSPTNKGARLINGQTIHSMYYKFQHNKSALFKALENIQYIFIDEISMMTENFYELFNYIRRSFQKMKFIISGDFGQLPPVKDTWTGDYKNSPALWLLCGGNRIQLTKCRRSDDELFELCKKVENININQFKPTEKTYLNIAYTHKTRMRVNNECMERYLSETKKSFTFIPKYDNNVKTQDVKLCVGMPIIAHLTEKKLDILNSEKFVVKSIDAKNVVVVDGDRFIKVALENFHKYFYLGFCITIYASQGETFENKYTIYDWNFKHFCNKGKYVALSRATNINNIQIGYNKCVDCEVDCKLYYRCLDCHKTKMGWCDYICDNNDDEENGNDYGDEDLYAN